MVFIKALKRRLDVAHKNNEQNLIPLNKRTKEEQREIQVAGGIASGEARREIGKMRRTLEKMLSKTNTKGTTYDDNIALGLIANAIDRTKGGNPRAYELIARMLGELEMEKEPPVTPELKIEIVNNESLESVMYENN